MKRKDTNGITLIALVITIVLIVIMSSVIINTALNNGGIFSKSKTAREKYKISAASEKLELGKTSLIPKRYT